MKQVSDAGGRFPRCKDLLRLIDGSEREGSGSGPPIVEKCLQPTRLVRAESLERCFWRKFLVKIESDLPPGHSSRAVRFSPY